MAVLSPALDPAQPTGLLQGGRFDQRNEDLAVVNPYTGEEIARVAVGGPDDVGTAVADALGHLPPPPPSERAEVLERAARLVARPRRDVREDDLPRGGQADEAGEGRGGAVRRTP